MIDKLSKLLKDYERKNFSKEVLRLINMKKLYLLLQNIETGRQFFKYFETEFQMDKFKRKIKYSPKIMVIEDSRDMVYDYTN